MEKYKQLIGQVIWVNSRDVFFNAKTNSQDGYNMIVSGILKDVKSTHLLVENHCGKFLIKYETIIYVLRVKDGKWVNGDWNGRC